MAEKCAAHDMLIDEMKNTREDIRAFRLEFRTAVDSLVIQREEMASQKTHTKNLWWAVGVVVTLFVLFGGWLWAHISATGGK